MLNGIDFHLYAVFDHLNGIRSGVSESSHSVSHDIGSGAQIRAGSCSQIHQRPDSGQHLLCFPACHGHILHSFTGFRGGKLRRRTHLKGLFSKCFHCFRASGNFASCNSKHFGHLGIKSASCFIDRRCSLLQRYRNGRCHGSATDGEILAHVGHLALSALYSTVNATGIQVKTREQFANFQRHSSHHLNCAIRL